MVKALEECEPARPGGLSIVFMESHGSMHGDSTRIMTFRKEELTCEVYTFLPTDDDSHPNWKYNNIFMICSLIFLQKCIADNAKGRMTIAEVVEILDKRGGDWLVVPLICRNPSRTREKIVVESNNNFYWRRAEWWANWTSPSHSFHTEERFHWPSCSSFCMCPRHLVLDHRETP